VRGTYSAILAGLDRLRAEHRRGPFPIVRAVTTITKATVRNLDKIQAALAELGIREWQISNYFFATPDVVRAHALFHEETNFGAHLALDVVDDEGYLDAGEVDAIGRALDAVIRKCARDGIRLEYAWGTDLEKYYSSSPPSRRSTCTSIDAVMEVRPDGRMTICNDAVTVGSLDSMTIEEAWQGAAMKRFLKVYRERGILPMCFRCCGICQANAVCF
jgi:MoaA/NifB/PqqE/SkfB family radical SAM enzyme